MKRNIFILGGARSGKSDFGLSLAGSVSSGKKIYLATAKAHDPEMEERIRLHRKTRGALWETVEEETDITGALLKAPDNAVMVVDCLTLWMTNLMALDRDDAEVLSEAETFLRASATSNATVIVISNEVGLSIVPENGLARRFRDLSGTMNRSFAKAADEVYFIAAGLPLRLK